MLKIGKREFVLISKRDFERLAAHAREQIEDEYWARSALKAEADARKNKERPIPFEEVERELDALARLRRKQRGRRR